MHATRPTHRKFACDRRSSASAVAVLAIAWLALAFLLHRDFGTTWDDPFHAKVGELALRWFETHGADVGIDTYSNARICGPLHDMVPAVLHRAFDAELFDLRHLWNALFAALMFPALWLLLRGLAPAWLPAIACVALFTLPRFFGDAFLNSKDAPFAVAVAWFHVGLLRLVGRSAPRGRDFALFGALLGFALIERPGGFVALLVETLAVLVVADILRARAGLQAKRGFIVPFLRALALAWILMILPWPAALREPIRHPLHAMGVSMQFTYEYPVFYGGEFVSSAKLPRLHLPWLVVLTTPVAHLVLALVGLAVALKAMSRAPRSRRGSVALVAVAWLFVPLLAVVALRPNVYDGIRHFLYVLPALAVLIAVGAVGVVRAASRRVPRWIAVAAVAIAVLAPIPAIARLHPYEYVYYGAAAGGLDGAAVRYETDYFTTAYREAMAFVNERASREPGRTMRVLVGGADLMFPGVSVHAAPNVEVGLVRPDRPAPTSDGLLPPGVDFYFGTTRFRLAIEPFSRAPIVHRIEREGVTLCVVRAR